MDKQGRTMERAVGRCLLGTPCGDVELSAFFNARPSETGVAASMLSLSELYLIHERELAALRDRLWGRPAWKCSDFVREFGNRGARRYVKASLFELRLGSCPVLIHAFPVPVPQDPGEVDGGAGGAAP